MSALDESTAAALREAGLDPDGYVRMEDADAAPDADMAPPADEPSAPDPGRPRERRRMRMTRRGRVQPPASPEPSPVDESLPEDLRGLGYSRRQMDYAVRQTDDPARQLDMYARMDDVRRMAEVAANNSALSEDELETLSRTLNIPPNLAELLAKDYPDELERRKLYARMVSVAGKDSYFALRFSRDANYAARQRGHEMELANLQAALTNAYASTGEIAKGWLKNAADAAWTESVYGIPAGLSQQARDIRDREWTPEAETPIPEGMERDDPAGYALLEGINQQIRQKNEMMAALLADPETREQAERNSRALDNLDKFLQDGYLDRQAASYSGDIRTGNWHLDNLARPVVEGVPSFASAAAETAVLGPLAPLVHFGAQAETSSYRDMRAEGVDIGVALPLAIARGLAEGTIESLSMGNIFKGAGVWDFLRAATGPSVTRRAAAARVLGHGLKAGVGEAAEEVMQGMAEAATTPLARAISLGDPYANVFTAIYESGEDLAKQGWGGFVLGFFGGGFLGNSRRELSDMRKYNVFQKTLTPLVAAGDAAVANGKSVAEVRREVRVMAQAAVAEGKGDMGTTVYADPGDVETYLQGKPREAAEQTLADIGVTPEAFRQAKADRTDIEIPMENLAVQEGGADPKLTRLFRPTPTMATAAAIVNKTREAAGVFELARSLRKRIDADVSGKAVPAPVQTLRNDLRTHLGYKAEEADFVASLAWAWGRTQAEKRGLDAERFLEDANIRAAMDAWIRRNPAWLAGARARTDAAIDETETYHEADGDADHDASASIDPAMGEREMAVPEQSGDGSGGVPGAEPGTAAQPVPPGGGGAGGQDVRTPAPVQERALFAAPPRAVRAGEYADRLTGLPFAMETASTRGVKTDPGAFQFKREADAETGVKRGEEIPGDVNPAALGTMVLYEDVDGDRFVVSGHHRLDLLRRKGEEAEVRAVVLRENDGWTTDQARVYGAALNIQEGGGDVDDYAAFFREAKIDGDQAAKEGLLRRESARTGYAIGALGSDNVFYGFLNEELSAKRAAAVANAAPGDHAIQDMMIERKIPTPELETFAGYVRKMRNSGVLNLDGVQLSLFAGADHSALLAAMEKESKAAAKEAQALDKKAASLESLLKAGNVLTTEELRRHGARAGDREGLRLEAAELRAEAGRWRHFFHHPDILAQVQERAGTAVRPAESFRQDSRGMDEVAKASIKAGDLYDDAMANRTINRTYEDLLPVSEKSAALVRRRTGIDISDLTRGVGTARIRHGDNRHGEGGERFRGQAPIDKEMFSLYPLVVSDPDNVHPSEPHRESVDGTNFKEFPRILSEKDINGTIYVVEEVRRNEKKGKYRLAFITMWKKEGGEPGVQQTSVTPQAESLSLGATDSPSITTVRHGSDVVKALPAAGETETETSPLELDFHDINYSNAVTQEKREQSVPAVAGHKPGAPDSNTPSKDTIPRWIDAVKAPPAAGETETEASPADGVVKPDETFEQNAQGRKRGEVQLYRADAQHRQAAIIRVMKGGDMSTVLHELAHVFLADMRDYVASGSADIDTVRDYGKLLRAVGDMTVEDNVEQAVRWFEEYLREGRAPAVELVKPFGVFSKWLNRVYPSVRDYVGAEMDPETRGVFDRWLASEREIAEAEAYYGGLHSANFLNLIDDEEKRREMKERLEHNRRRVMNRHAGEMAKAWTNANAERNALTKEAKREVEAVPVYRAVEAARKGGLDRAAAEKTVGKATVLKIIDAHGDVFVGEAADIDVKGELRRVGYTEPDPVDVFLKELSEAVPVADAVRKEGSHGRRKRYYEALEAIAKAGGIDAERLPAMDFETFAGLDKHPGLFRPDARDNLDRIAVAAGFDTPSAMLDAMAAAPAIGTAIEQAAERKVRAKAKEARAWAEESLVEVMDAADPAGQSALHDPDDNAMADTIELQRQALRQALGGVESRRADWIDRRAMADAAKRSLHSLPLREAMAYNNHAKAERHWSDQAAKAMAKGDLTAALAALDKQQKFHALTSEAFRIRRNYADFMRRYGVRMARSELATVKDDYRDAVRDILTWSGVVVDKSGRFAPENADPDRLILPEELRDEYDKAADSGEGDGYDPSLDAFAPSAKTLIPAWIRDKKTPRGFMGNILDLTPAHMEDIDVSVKTLVKYGREELTALRDEDNRRVSDIRDKLMAVMETLPDKRRLRPDKKPLDRMRSGVESYLFANLSIDTLAAEVDGFSMHQGKGMGLMQNLVDAIRGSIPGIEFGEVRQMELLENFRDATADDFRTVDAFVGRLEKEKGRFFNQDGVPSPAEATGGRSADTEWDPDMVVAMMFNAGNRGNYHALRNGYGLTDGQLDAMFSLATEKEWLAVQHIAKEIGGLFELLDAVHYRMTNRHLERVRPEPFAVTTADGKPLELDGWYYPLVFDPRLSDTAARNNEAAEYRAVMGTVFNPQKLRDGFTHKRATDEDGNPVVTHPPLLKTRVLIEHMTTATRWATLAEPLMEFRRITMDPEFRDLFVKKLGEDRYRDLRMWTNRMARPEKGSSESWNKMILTFRNASTVASLGLNIRSSIRQLSSAGLAADEMSKASGNTASGWRFMLRGLRKMGLTGTFSRLLSPLGFTSAATEEMFRLSPEAKHRAENVNKEIREALDKWRPDQSRLARKWGRVKDHLFHFTIAVDHMVSGAAFWGSVEQFATGNAGVDVTGMTRDEMMRKAVQYANRIVRTQQSPYQADYTRLQSDKGAISLFTQFMGGLTPYLNSSYVNIQLARRLGWKKPKPLFNHIVNAYVLPSVVLTMLLREAGAMLTGDDDEEEEGELAWELAEEISGQMFGALPVTRDFVRYGVRGARRGKLDERDLTPPSIQFPARIGKRLFSGAAELADGDAYAAGKDVGMAAAEILGVAAPIRQAKPLAEAWDWLEED